MYGHGSKQLDILKMCEDCRVIVVTESDFDPHSAPQRPHVRTTDDYLQEREERRRAGEDDN
jgi:hypothetical protein